MNEVYTVKELKRAEKKARFRENFYRKYNDFKYWCINNKEEIMIFGPIVIGCIATCVKVAGKHANLRKEEDLKDLYCYDRSLGHYWRLKRELSNQEWIEIDRRKKDGERLSDILDQLKVLK